MKTRLTSAAISTIMLLSLAACSKTGPVETQAVETTAPASTVVETTVPETTIPETTVPETTIPETTVPVTTPAPTTVAPVTTKAPTTTKAPSAPTTVADPRSASEIASAFASSISNVIDNLAATGANVGYQKMNSIWAKYKALGATLSWYDAALSPSNGTNAEFADNYRIALRGESFCYKNTEGPAPDYNTIYSSTSC